MSDKLKKQIQEARPSLRAVSPVSFWFIMLMGLFNLFIGSAFMFALDPDTDDLTFRAITQFIPFGVWGALFVALGIAKLWSLKTNNWKLARYTLLLGVVMKSSWAVALTIRTFYQPDNAFLNATWLALAITQVICYIYFLPPTEPRLPNGGKVKA